MFFAVLLYCLFLRLYDVLHFGEINV